ncbi:MAG: DNA-protecting protein DprA [Lentisphaerae bacterium]|nr:DNA-protecting protein DprA [Lentisphaerota bacterium]
MTDRDAYIALNLIDQLGPVRVRALVAHLGSLQAIFEADEASLRGAEGIGRELAASIVARRVEADPAAEEARARALSARLVTPADPDYPAALLKIHDPPLALYVAGDLTPRDRQCIGVVGSRRCTQYGKGVADRLGFQLAKAGFTVVSGLARGIDIAAHEGALKAGGRTIAVLGGALDCLYPAEARPLADRIAKQGAVISEYTLGREPDRTTFPYRNRVISGLSMGVVVVEADRKSGAMITADQAGEQGRQVFAVPGRIDQPSSHGTHHLIRQGAKLVEDVRDILEEFEYLIPPSATASAGAGTDGSPAPEAPAAPAFVFGPEEGRVVEALAEGELDVDTLSRRAAVPVAKLGALLIGLEMKRVVRMLPGRRVVLTVTLPRKEAEGE